MWIGRRVIQGFIITGAVVLGAQSAVFAQPGGRDSHHQEDHIFRERHHPGFRQPSLPESIFRVVVASMTYFYDDGVYYVRDGAEYVVIDPPLGAVVRAVPVYYRKVVINGVVYYTADDVYYVRVRSGYQVVPRPVTVVQAAPVVVVQSPAPASGTTVITPVAPVKTEVVSSPQGDDAFEVNIPNDQGGYTPVLIKRTKDGFLGPQGEFYADFPKVAQLKAMYGKTK